MITIGIDFHKKTSTCCVITKNGQILRNCKIMNNKKNIREFIQSFDEPKRIAMESTRSWGLFYETIKDLSDDFQLGHPLKMKAISSCETKNDKVDANMIARLAHNNFLPKVFIPNISIRDLRAVVRFRGILVNQRRSIRNQIHALIDNNVWPDDKPKSFKNIFCKRGREWLSALALSENQRFILDESLEAFDQISKQILNIEAFLQQQEVDIPGLKYLRSTPGFKFSKINAYCVLLEIADIKRFRKATGLMHYAGFIPREYSSGEKYRTGRLIKQANMRLRTAIIESTFAAIRTDPGLKAYYKSVKLRRGSGPAIIATARKLCKAIYYVLKEQRSYKLESFKPPVADCHSSMAKSCI